MSKNLERRFFKATEMELRITDGDKGKRIGGYFGVYNSRSVDMGGWYEIIKPGAFNRNFSAEIDCRALFNHDPSALLGRTKSGTLQLSGNARGGQYLCDLADNHLSHYLETHIERGDIDGTSFGFYTITDSWKVQDGVNVRELIDVSLDDGDVSPCTYPAYPAANTGFRSKLNSSEIREVDKLCHTLVRLQRNLDIQDGDASLVKEYRSSIEPIVTEEMKARIEELLNLDRRMVPLDILRKRIQLLEI